MELGTALSALTAAVGLAKAGIDARDEAKINAALTEINRKHLDLSTAALQLAEKLHALQSALDGVNTENAKLRTKIAQRENYVLHEISPGRFCYKFEPIGESRDPTHYLCQICYDQGFKSVLRFHSEQDWVSRHYACAAVDKGAHDLYF